MKDKPRKRNVPVSLQVPIVGDGGLANPKVMDGRFIPVLILDTSGKPEMSEVIRVHRVLGITGDVQSQWATSRDDADRVFLHLSFSRPMDVDIYVPFSIERQGILVEMILRSEIVCLQSGSPGDVPSSKFGDPSVFAEIPGLTFREAWDHILLKRMTNVMARKSGLPRRKARLLAEELIADMVDAVSRRVGSPASPVDGDRNPEDPSRA